MRHATTLGPRAVALAAPAALGLLFALPGCSCSPETAPGDDGGTGGTDVGRMDGMVVVPDVPEGPDTPGINDGGIAIAEDGAAPWRCYVTACAGHTLECGNCTDNDGDGLVDSHDPECLGPCDNTEGPGLAAGVGGETGGPCLADCYFDFGNGPGNDDCHWDHRCDPLAVAPDFPPEGSGCAFDSRRVGGRDCPDPQSDMCHDFCSPLTPNGCDCFGCCTFDELDGTGPGGADEFVWIGALTTTGEGTCTFASIEDPALCPPCTPVGDCFNDCGPCELCVGRDTLPPECLPPGDGGIALDAEVPDGGIPMRCPTGLVACGLPGDPECAPDFYCVTGCCQPIIF